MAFGGPIEKPGHEDADSYLTKIESAVEKGDIGLVRDAGLKLTTGLANIVNEQLNPTVNRRLAAALDTSDAGFSIQEDLNILQQAVTGMAIALDNRDTYDIVRIAKWYARQIKHKKLFSDAYDLDDDVISEETLEEIQYFSDMIHYLGKLGAK